MADYTKFYKARDILTKILCDDLVGPVYKDEIIGELPTQYYIMGKLYPQNDKDDVIDLVRNPFLENAAETYDASISLSNQMNPSSMGITFTLKSGVDEFVVDGLYAFYNPIQYEEAKENGIDTSKWDDLEDKPKEIWQRSYFKYSKKIQLNNTDGSQPITLGNGVQLQIFTHKLYKDGERTITVAMINTNQASDDIYEKTKLSVFQPQIRVSGVDSVSIFTSVNRQELLTDDEELLELNLLYADVLCYGQGHGCSVEWDMDNSEPLWVSSSWIPSYNLRQMMASQIDDDQVLSMKYLSTTEPKNLICSLHEFIQTYSTWISQQSDSINNLDCKYREIAKKNITKCQDAFLRMKSSVDLLERSSLNDGKAVKAFQLANEAMFLQRKQSIIKAGKDFDANKVTWYPFQLAFILHELSSFIDPTSVERNIVDLLWFPTGGGKTEAYLGITAFVIFLRRIRNSSDDGVTVIMRYTLRLLTLQQFERASMLIFACELLRKKYNLGGAEISIGLWVGGSLTPNKLDEARVSISKQLCGAVVDGKSDPCQIKICPWCGHHLTAHDYSVRTRDNRMLISCPNRLCDFHGTENGLPLHIIDDSIYEHLPTFIVATVDKFAQIPLNDKPAALFGISSGKNPPDLIIQDELHLISGPLGTMTGIYEAAITQLCKKNGVGAKIIASTATIRNAGKQILALYGKKYTQFPPQGITAKNSYFAIESTPDVKPARKYLGVMGVGTTATTTLIRVNAALLFASRYLAALGYKDDVVDNFWTLTGYFNSLRELGGASTQILDDVQSRFNYLAKTKFYKMTPAVDTSVPYDNLIELTSRMNNSQITKVIQEGLKRSYAEGKHKDVYDFVLASNMISVGVDVGRLGAMIVAGQPKTNSEYIQASSRVGRENPGLVITVYNPTRSRDRSHYEQFLKYHSALYRYVEATSLTPFADRARDRGLHALYVSLCRYLVPDMLANRQAKAYDPQNENVQNIRRIIYEYVKEVDPDELDCVMKELQVIEDEWNNEASESLVYKSYKNEKMLLKADIEDSRFRTMNSLRSVDAQAGIYLLGR